MLRSQLGAQNWGLLYVQGLEEIQQKLSKKPQKYKRLQFWAPGRGPSIHLVLGME